MQTKKQDLLNKIKHFIEEYYGQFGASPSIRCIAKNVGCSKSNVSSYIDYLKEQGILEFADGRYQTDITRATETMMVAVPKLGYVPCGPLTEEYECIDGYVRLPLSFVGNAKKCFLLTARGNSMVNAGINNGDLVLIRQQATAEIGDIVVALVDNEVTLKRLAYDDEQGCYYLHPENRRYNDIYVEELMVQGVAVKVIKDLL